MLLERRKDIGEVLLLMMMMLVMLFALFGACL